MEWKIIKKRGKPEPIKRLLSQTRDVITRNDKETELRYDVK